MKKSVNSLYIHIPFCSNICSYCDFSKRFYNEEICSKYLDALEQEIKLNYKNDLLKTIYIGGGTPSSLSINNLKKLFKILKILNIDSNYEYTIEVNPENIDEEKLKLFKENKINRISMGIQSTNDDILKYLNRSHNFELVKEKIKLIKKYFNNINVDLMYAIPNETLEILNKDIENILSLNINHISCYSLIINEHTILGNNNTKNIDEDLDRQMYELIDSKLKLNGFDHYEISNYAKDDTYSRHNTCYWNNDNYYGFGLGASGYLDNYRYDNTKVMSEYINGNYIYNKEILNKEDIISYHLILGFRKLKGIDINDFNNKYNCNIIDLYNIKELLEKDILIIENDHIKINNKYIYVQNSILVNFI